MAGTDELALTPNALEHREDQRALSIKSIDDIKRISLIFVKSGMFKGDNSMSEEQKMYQAGVKIIAGVEFGIQPFAAMRGINIIKGNAEMSANLMAAKVKKHPKYDYRVKQWDQDGCVLTFYELPHPQAPRDSWDELGDSSFDAEDAKQARLAGGDNWQKFARNMYFARAMSNGVRIYCPDVFYGAPVYSEGEISSEERIVAETPFEEPTEQEAEVDELLEREPSDEAAPESAEPEEPEKDTPVPDDEAEDEVVPPPGTYVTPTQRKRIMAQLNDLAVEDRDERLELLSNIVEREIKSTNMLTKAEAEVVIKELSELKKKEA